MRIQKIKTRKTRLNQFNLIAVLGLILIYILVCCSSCAKKEPENSPLPEKIMADVIKDLELGEDFTGIVYNSESETEAQTLSEEKAKELYSEKENAKNNQPIDISKIEKYIITLGTDTSPNEIGIFRLYRDSASTEYVKNMAKNRILSIQHKFEGSVSGVNSDIAVANSGEARSYGNYVYYVIHPEKDKIFEKIEDIFKGEEDKQKI